MQKTCTLSGKNFEVSNQFLEHLDKVSPIIAGTTYKVPTPSLCPEERMRRRLSFRNQQTLYRRTCDASKKPIISIYSPDKSQSVYSPDAWWSDTWDAITFGKNYDFQRSFFEQFTELMRSVPHIGVLLSNAQNSDYTNQSYDTKDCYLSSALKKCDSVLFSQNCNNLTTCADCSYCFKGELLYECTDTYDSYNCKYAYHCQNCSDSWFLYDCIGCKNCFGSVGLRQQEYVFFNTPLSRDDYQKKVAEYMLYTFRGVQRGIQDFWNFVDTIEHTKKFLFNCENVTGNNVRNSRNCSECFDSLELEDCMCSTWIFGCKDSVDCYGMGDSELVYECMGVEEVQTVAFSFGTSSSQNCYYTDLCFNCSNCFGCVCLRNKEYCIFNKEYSKQEYEQMVPKIITAMTVQKAWGEFFPISTSAFCYNESKAFEIFPLEKSQVSIIGGTWKEDVGENPTTQNKILATQLPDSIHDIPDDILNWAIVCEASAKPFKLTKLEFNLYKQLGISIPHLHPNERMQRRMMLRQKS